MRVLFSFKTVSKRVVSFTLAFFIIISSISFESKASNNVQIIEAIQVKQATFNTGIIPNENYTIEIRFSLKNPTKQYANIYEAGKMAVRNEASIGLMARYGWYNEKLYKPEADLEYYVCQKENVFTLNNDAVRKAAKQTLNNTVLTFGNFVGTISYFCVKNENSQNVMELYPAIDNNGKVCMYDNVSKQYVYGKGTITAVNGENKYYKYSAVSTNTEQKDEVVEETQQEKENDQNKENDQKENDSIKDTQEEEKKEANTNDDKEEEKFVKVKALKIDNGTFNTKIKIDPNNSCEMIFAMSNIGIYKDIISSSPYVLRNESKSGLYFTHGWYKEKVHAVEVDVMIDYLQKKNVAYVNGIKKRTATMQNVAATKNLIFGGFKGIIEAFKVWDQSDKLIADYIPVIDEEGVACLYDNISGSFLYCSNKCTPVYGSAVTHSSATQTVPKDMSQEEKTEEKVDNGDMNTPAEVEEEKTEPEETDNSVERQFRKELITMIENGDTSAHDISKYGFKSFRDTEEIFNDVIKNECRIAYNSVYSMYKRITTENGIVKTFQLCNIDDGFLTRYGKMKSLVNTMKSRTTNMTDIQKAVYYHDYIIDKTTYSKSANLDKTAAGALINGRANCLGYSGALALLLNEAGVESDLVHSSEMGHCWVKIKIDGYWYFIDPTFDDTMSGKSGEVDHWFFMRSPEKFASMKYKGWTEQLKSNTKYDNWEIHDVIGKINYSGDKWYYKDVNNGKVVYLNF